MIPLPSDERVFWLLHAESVIAYTQRNSGWFSAVLWTETHALRAALEHEHGIGPPFLPSPPPGSEVQPSMPTLAFYPFVDAS